MQLVAFERSPDDDVPILVAVIHEVLLGMADASISNGLSLRHKTH